MAGAYAKRRKGGGLGAAKPRLAVGRVRAALARAPRRPAWANRDAIDAVLRWEPSGRRSPSLRDGSAALGRLG
jgi:hypothetical protein